MYHHNLDTGRVYGDSNDVRSELSGPSYVKYELGSRRDNGLHSPVTRSKASYSRRCARQSREVEELVVEDYDDDINPGGSDIDTYKASRTLSKKRTDLPRHIIADAKCTDEADQFHARADKLQEGINKLAVRGYSSYRAEAMGSRTGVGGELRLHDGGTAQTSGNILSRRDETSTRRQQRRSLPRNVENSPITPREAIELRRLVMGSGRTPTPLSWKQQGFTFSNIADLGYGFIQHAGGPCGILAAVQAHLMDELLFLTPDKTSPWHKPTKERCVHAFVRALARILWRCAATAAEDTCAPPVAKLCTISSTTSVDRTADYIPDGATERMRIWCVSSESDLQDLIVHHAFAFTEEQGTGVLCFLYSALLSRTIAAVRDDMDTECGGSAADKFLIDRYGYASQEAVNLLMIGRARSNVFDGSKTLQDTEQGSNDAVSLRGIPSRSDIGLLTLDEAYGYYQVGDNFKSPRRPIWVIYSESHYSTLFGDDPRIISNRHSPDMFRLHYYDCLGGQDERIRLLIDTKRYSPKGENCPPNINDPTALIPPLDLVIRTKWPNASVEWQGCEPIL